jgi:mono/diheme cytochrome c family protein
MNRKRVMTAAYLVLVIATAGLALWGCGGQKAAEQSAETPAAGTAGTVATDTAAGGEVSLAVGDAVYKTRCAMCHGESGKGDGPAGQALNPRPRDHTDAAYMSTLTDQSIENTILNGKGTGMPPHKGLLTDAEVKSLVLKVRSLSQK